MTHWQEIREKAAKARREVLKACGIDAGTLVPPEKINTLAAKHFKLELCREHKDSENLRNSLAVLEDGIVFYRNDLPEWFKQYCIAHEFGHHVLHEGGSDCGSKDIDTFEGDDEPPSAARQVEGYGAGERKEREANAFAAEFLLPCEVLRKQFLEFGAGADEIADATGLPIEMVCGQLARAVLTPEVVAVPEREFADFKLDASQKAAAEAENCPLLITAGPGTGKTQTLVRRILYLLNEKEILPERILALTFSNKATEEMRERVAQNAPELAGRIPIMTLHSFGLEILRKYWDQAGLRPDSPIIERLDAILFLEKELKALRLRHFQMLHEPTFYLSSMLSVISRAKDELVGPERFAELAEKQLNEATGEEEKAEAEKCLETARVYSFYQNHLDKEQKLDFGDLIFRAVRLLQEKEKVRDAVRSRYDAILVDEFQDINRASGLLLREVAGSGKGLWAVGDLRQSIYRWRGASPANLKQFRDDFPGASEMSLEVNYRSGQKIIDLFSAFAREMRAMPDPDFRGWNAFEKGATADISYGVAPNVAAEAEHLAELVLRHRDDGIALRDQAVICRTHAQLNRFAEKLVEKGVPILFLGDLFEREEIRDLLSLLDLKSSPKGFGLIRVADFPDYQIPPDDVDTLLAESQKEGRDFMQVLADPATPGLLSDDGKPGFAALKTHLDVSSANVSAWNFLSAYLFRNSRYLRRFLDQDKKDVQNAQRLLAIYQFLNFLKGVEARFAGEGDRQIAAALTHVRRLARFGDDKNFSQVPESAENLEAVRLLTVHAAKGLEFDVVFLPYLGNGTFPFKRQGEKVKLPHGIIPDIDDQHDEEEECLFFVGMSRAKKFLHLSRSERYGKNRTSISPFLALLEDHLPVGREIDPVPDPEETEGSVFYQREFSASQIKRYTECPRRFYYQDVRKMGGRSEEAVYLKFHSVVYKTIDELQRILRTKVSLTVESALSKLDECWMETDIDEHAYAPIYRETAVEMISRVVDRIVETTGEIVAGSLFFECEHGVIWIKPDHLEVSDGGVAIRRFRTRKAPFLKEGKKEEVEFEEGLLYLGAQKKYPEQPITVEKVYLADNIRREVEVSDKVLKLRTEKLNSTLIQIRSGKFPAVTNSERCPNCQYYFVCPK